MSELKLSAPAPVQEPQLPSFKTSLLDSVDINALKTKAEEEFNTIEMELSSMKVELSEVPSSESLMQLATIQAKGRAYFERASEVFRKYLKFLSNITLLNKKAEFVLQQEIQKASVWMHQYKAQELRGARSGEERQNMINAILPEELFFEKFQWDSLESQIKTNFTIIKSYYEQFKSVRDEILVQLSIIKNLISLGEIKIDPEAVRAFRIIEGSYSPTRTDINDLAESSTVEEMGIDEGTVNF